MPYLAFETEEELRAWIEHYVKALTGPLNGFSRERVLQNSYGVKDFCNQVVEWKSMGVKKP